MHYAMISITNHSWYVEPQGTFFMKKPLHFVTELPKALAAIGAHQAAYAGHPLQVFMLVYPQVHHFILNHSNLK